MSLFLFPFSFPSSAHPPLLLGRGGLSWGVVRGWVVTGEGVSCSTAEGHLTTESRVTMTSIMSCMEVTPPVSDRQGMELCVVNHEMPNNCVCELDNCPESHARTSGTRLDCPLLKE